MGRREATRRSVSWAWSLAGFLLLAQAFWVSVAQALPEVKLGTGVAITPAEADSWFAAQGLSSPTWSEDPELKRLAAALGNDPDRIYAYVRNEIDVIPLFGVKAGARGAMIDKAGTPFDQAQLMVELLRSAGIAATYQMGTITLTGAQFNSWFGVTNAAAARKLLADGGYPASVSGATTVTSVTMSHLWVKATIGGVGYMFDPAFKEHSFKAGIDVGSVMGFNAASFWASAVQGASSETTFGTARTSTLNRAGIRSGLSAHATSLLNHISANFPTGAIEDVIGGRSITAAPASVLRQTSLPSASLVREFTGDIPLVLRTRLVITLGTTPLNFAMDDIYGKQLAVEVNRNNPAPTSGTPARYRLLLGEQPATSWLSGVPEGVSVQVNHPYAAGTNAATIDGTYMDRAVMLKGSRSAGMQIFIMGGRPSSDLAAYQERTHAGRSGVVVFQKGCSVSSSCGEGRPEWVEPQQLALRRRMGAAFMSQFWDMTQAVGNLGGGIVLVHDVVGAASVINLYHADSESPVASSFNFSMEPSVSTVLKSGSTATQPLMRTVATMTSALEGSLAQQAGDSVYPVSAVAQLDWANSGPAAANRWYYHATPANWNSWVRSQILEDYGDLRSMRSPMRDIADAYIAQGWSLMIPRSSSLGPGPATRLWCIPQISLPPSTITSRDCTVVGPERAGAFVAIHPVTGAVAHISARDGISGDGYFSKGGGGSADVETNPARVFSIGEDFLDRQFTARAEAHNVDLKSGALSLNPAPDLVVGNGDYPYSLTFQRSWRHQYNTDEDHYDAADPMNLEAPKDTVARDDLFGASGWTSNLHHYASVTSDGAKVFGEDDPRVAAQTLATIRVLLAFSGNGASELETLQRQIVSAMAAFWWTETLQLNTITVHQGHASRVFTKLHDGSFQARGSAERAELLGARTILAPSTPSAFGGNTHRWWYQHCVRLTGARREVTIYGNWDGINCTAAAPNGLVPTEGDTGDMQFASQTFPFGVTVTWNKSTRRLSNSLGRWIEVSPAGTVSGSGVGLVSYSVSDAASVSGVAPSLTVTDLGGHTWRYIEDMARTSLEVRTPAAPNQPLLRYSFAPDSNGSVSTIRDALGNITTYHIGGGRVSSVVSPLGHATRTRHDRFGNVVSVEDPLGRTSRTEYDNLRRKVKEIAPEGNAVSYQYDARSNVTTTTRTAKPGVTPALSPTSTTAIYDTLCNIKLTETNALGATTSWSINQSTCLVTEMRQPTINGKVPTTKYVYNSIGKMIQKMDPTELVTQINYDNLGNPTAVIVNPGASPNLAITTLFTYDAAGNITSVTDPRGKTHTGTYDALRRLVRHDAPAATGVSTTWTYNPDGLITQISRANGATPSVTAYTYWPTGRVRTMTDPDGQVTRYDYDAANRPTFITDPELRRTLKVYNAASEVIEERRAVGTLIEQAYVRYTYTLNGKQASVRDVRGNQTSYSYDGFDRPLRTTFPNATFEQLTYDVLDRVTAKLTRASQTITNTYDVLDRLVTHTVPQPGTTAAIVTTTTYDEAGRTRAISDTTGQGLSYGFDAAKRVISASQTAPNITGARTLTYWLDAAGNRTRTIWPDGYYVVRDYDDINRPTTVRENGTFVLATYVHDPLSRRTSLVYGNGTTQSYAWSQAGDLTAHTHTLSGTANTWTLGYSKAHQLVSEAASNASWGHVASVDETTSYGAANNLNQYVTVAQGASPSVTLTHDANGNLTGEGTWTFAYDAENRLRTANRAGTAATYLYDPLGRRQAKVVNGVTTSFLSDGSEEVAEYTGAGALLRRYIPGPGTDQPIAMVTPAGASHTRSYFHVNRQGSTVAMSNDAGVMAEGPYTYDAYGQGPTSAGVPFKYTGRRLDPETGLYYYRARYYSASLGRFLQTDPVGYADQMNLYAYVANDPTNNVDPKGEFAQVLFGAGVGALTNIGVQLFQNGFDVEKTVKNFNGKSFAVAVAAGAATGGVASVIQVAGISPVAGALADRAASTVIGAVAGVADTAASTPNATAKDYVKGAVIGAVAGFSGAVGGTIVSVTSKSVTGATATAVTTSAAVAAIPLVKPSPSPQPPPSSKFSDVNLNEERR